MAPLSVSVSRNIELFFLIKSDFLHDFQGKTSRTGATIKDLFIVVFNVHAEFKKSVSYICKRITTM